MGPVDVDEGSTIQKSELFCAEGIHEQELSISGSSDLGGRYVNDGGHHHHFVDDESDEDSLSGIETASGHEQPEVEEVALPSNTNFIIRTVAPQRRLDTEEASSESAQAA